MSGETSITVIGNLTTDPELRYTSGGGLKHSGRELHHRLHPRIFDAQAKEWKDGETLFLRASVWRDAAENVAASLTKGSRVVASGVLKPRSYETKAGEKRTVVGLEVEEIGLSLRYTAATANRPQDGRRATSPIRPATEGGKHPADDFTISAREYADDDAWFGMDANPSGRVSLPAPAPEPAGW
jgi:single-strand DNA-binding protein